jgi:hypothetical protein
MRSTIICVVRLKLRRFLARPDGIPNTFEFAPVIEDIYNAPFDVMVIYIPPLLKTAAIILRCPSKIRLSPFKTPIG